jgi:hypothetical protein
MMNDLRKNVGVLDLASLAWEWFDWKDSTNG